MASAPSAVLGAEPVIHQDDGRLPQFHDRRGFVGGSSGVQLHHRCRPGARGSERAIRRTPGCRPRSRHASRRASAASLQEETSPSRIGRPAYALEGTKGRCADDANVSWKELNPRHRVATEPRRCCFVEHPGGCNATRIHEKGKPDGNRGRKAPGPERVAELPNEIRLGSALCSSEPAEKGEGIF